MVDSKVLVAGRISEFLKRTKFHSDDQIHIKRTMEWCKRKTGPQNLKSLLLYCFHFLSAQKDITSYIGSDTSNCNLMEGRRIVDVGGFDRFLGLGVCLLWVVFFFLWGVLGLDFIVFPFYIFM